jgi:hypothetical protein
VRTALVLQNFLEVDEVSLFSPLQKLSANLNQKSQRTDSKKANPWVIELGPAYGFFFGNGPLIYLNIFHKNSLAYNPGQSYLFSLTILSQFISYDQ